MPMIGSMRRRTSRGVALMEALVALVALAIGLLGLVASQARLMADSRGHAHRALAIGLIDDLANRIVLNRDAALGGSYDIAWSATVAAQDCSNASCSPAQKAQSDLNQWVAAVTSALPGGNATVFRSPSDPRQVGIVVAWSANEAGATAAQRNARVTALNTSFASSGSGEACPAAHLCQIVYVQP